jgi:hypothetical protein
VIWRFHTNSQWWREMPGEFGLWPTVYGRFRVWRNAGVFTALLEGVIAEAALQGQTDLSLVSAYPTTARAYHDAAGMCIGKEVMDALKEAAAEQERARQKGAARRNRTDRTEVTTPAGKSGGTSVAAQAPSEGSPARQVLWTIDQAPNSCGISRHCPAVLNRQIMPSKCCRSRSPRVRAVLADRQVRPDEFPHIRQLHSRHTRRATGPGPTREGGSHRLITTHYAP